MQCRWRCFRIAVLGVSGRSRVLLNVLHGTCKKIYCSRLISPTTWYNSTPAAKYDSDLANITESENNNVVVQHFSLTVWVLLVFSTKQGEEKRHNQKGKWEITQTVYIFDKLAARHNKTLQLPHSFFIRVELFVKLGSYYPLPVCHARFSIVSQGNSVKKHRLIFTLGSTIDSDIFFSVFKRSLATSALYKRWRTCGWPVELEYSALWQSGSFSSALFEFCNSFAWYET